MGKPQPGKWARTNLALPRFIQTDPLLTSAGVSSCRLRIPMPPGPGYARQQPDTIPQAMGGRMREQGRTFLGWVLKVQWPAERKRFLLRAGEEGGFRLPFFFFSGLAGRVQVDLRGNNFKNFPGFFHGEAAAWRKSNRAGKSDGPRSEEAGLLLPAFGFFMQKGNRLLFPAVDGVFLFPIDNGPVHMP